MFVRHGNTGKAATDEERQLTDKGQRQIALFREAHGAALSGLTHVFASSSLRTMETARLLVGPDGPAITALPSLYFGNHRTEDMKTADADLGYVPLDAIVDKYPDTYTAYTAVMSTSLTQAIAAASREGDILVVGHAGYLQFLAMSFFDTVVSAAAADTEVATEPRCEVEMTFARNTILHSNVGEACGFEMRVPAANREAPSVTYLESPEGTDFSVAPHNDAFTAQ